MITLYTGIMYSGKSTKLINEYEFLESVKMINNENTLCFKPSKDKRDKTKIRARNKEREIEAIVIEKFEDILKYIKEETKYIFIDEIQFLTGDSNILLELSINKNIHFYIAGLKVDYNNKAFGEMGNIMLIADDIKINIATCKCNNKTALYTVVENNEYKVVCRECYLKKLEGDTNG